MTFQQKLSAIFQWAATEVLPVAVKNPATQNTVLMYTGIGLTGIALIEALFSHTPAPTTAAVAPSASAAPVTGA